MGYVPRLKQEYKERVINSLKDEFGYKNIMEVPKLEKIIVSRGVGAAVADKKLIDHAGQLHIPGGLFRRRIIVDYRSKSRCYNFQKRCCCI